MPEIPIGAPLGPSAIAARIQELQARLNPKKTDTVAAPHQSENASFPVALQGNIGDEIGGNQPLSPFNRSAGLTSTAPPAMRSMIEQAAEQHGVDPDLLDALVKQESGYAPNSRSGAGAMGLTQLMPETARSLGVTDPFDIQQNLNGGAAYLRQQLDRFRSVPEALAAYNAGPGAVIKHGGIPPYRETQNYVRVIMENLRQRKGIS